MSQPVYRIVGAVSYQKDGEERSKYTELGVAWALNREGFRLQFDAIPANFSTMSILLLPNEERERSGKDDAPPAKQNKK